MGLWITPAYAGKSRSRWNWFRPEWDHPRLCGEKAKITKARLTILGSPPPMRGKGEEFAKAEGIQRITPAYAGKRLRSRWIPLFRWDHPRLCGEKVGGGMRFEFPFGITPAYAGKRSFTSFRISSYQDHPRLCGEKC